MIDIKPYIAGLIKDTIRTEMSYPESFSEIPTAVITETGNVSDVVLSGKDRISIITIQLDIYAADIMETEEKALAVNEILISKGLRRSFSQLMTNERVPRRCMRYSLGIDEVSGRILRY